MPDYKGWSPSLQWLMFTIGRAGHSSKCLTPKQEESHVRDARDSSCDRTRPIISSFDRTNAGHQCPIRNDIMQTGMS